MSFLEQLKKIIIYRKGFYNLMIHDENLSKYALLIVVIACI